MLEHINPLSTLVRSLQPQPLPSPKKLVPVELDHHPSSPLWLLADPREKECSPKDLWYAMALRRVNGPNLLTVDLPGGGTKHCLEESMFLCTVCKLVEECSLTINQGWLYNSGEVLLRGGLLEYLTAWKIEDRA